MKFRSRNHNKTVTQTINQIMKRQRKSLKMTPTWRRWEGTNSQMLLKTLPRKNNTTQRMMLRKTSLLLLPLTLRTRRTTSRQTSWIPRIELKRKRMRQVQRRKIILRRWFSIGKLRLEPKRASKSSKRLSLKRKASRRAALPEFSQFAHKQQPNLLQVFQRACQSKSLNKTVKMPKKRLKIMAAKLVLHRKRNRVKKKS